jgi:hypothetical protein
VKREEKEVRRAWIGKWGAVRRTDNHQNEKFSGSQGIFQSFNLGTSIPVVIRGCWALMADEREDPDFDMMVYDGHLDKSMKLRKEKIKALPFPAYIPDSNPSLRKYHHTALPSYPLLVSGSNKFL